MSFNDIVSFFMYVIPGFISTAIYREKYPGKKQTEFSQLTWSIAISIFIFVVSQQLDLHWLHWNLFPDNIKFPRIRTIIFLIVFAVIIAVLRIAKRELAEKFDCLKFFKIKPLSIWPIINNAAPSEWAYVTLADGSKYLGWIKEWTYDPNETDQDFLLAEAQKVDNNLKPIYKIDGKGIYLRTSWVVCIEFFKGKEVTHEKEKALKEIAVTSENTEK